MDRSVMNHDGPWSEDVYLALRHDGRVEVVDGTLLVGPGAGKHRAGVIERVRATVEAALPAGLAVVGPVPLRLGPDCVLVPDLIVTTAEDDAAEEAAKAGAGEKEKAEPAEAATKKDPSAEPMEASAALMVVDVIGCEHGAVDRTFKPLLYARSRIPYSLLIDHDGPLAVADMLIGGRYHEYAHAGEGTSLRIEEPFALELDLNAVTAPVPAAPPAAAPAPAPAAQPRAAAKA